MPYIQSSTDYSKLILEKERTMLNVLQSKRTNAKADSGDERGLCTENAWEDIEGNISQEMRTNAGRKEIEKHSLRIGKNHLIHSHPRGFRTARTM